jgi:CDGSH-type Zn-finger protein
MTLRLVAVPRGPLVIKHDEPIEIVAPDGSVLSFEAGRKIRLCRCGASSTRPLCDGSHNRIVFEAAPTPDEDSIKLT